LCSSLDKPLVLFFNETDCLPEFVLITFLRQLRKVFASVTNIDLIRGFMIKNKKIIFFSLEDYL